MTDLEIIKKMFKNRGIETTQVVSSEPDYRGGSMVYLHTINCTAYFAEDGSFHDIGMVRAHE